MSAEGEEAPVAPPFRLQTLGTLALRGPDVAVPPADFAQQGRRLALLATLAISGERGRSRDQLLLFFWPDASQQRARHSLEQALYLIRKSIDPAVFVGVNPIRLNPAVLSSDVEEFLSAIGRGSLEAAVEVYGGPFLDGIYLSDAPEFEQWVEVERARLEALYVKALETLAEAAEAVGEHRAAAGWWRRLSEVDSLSGSIAIGLIRTLAGAGDHAGALRYAQRYERFLEQEVGTGVGPEVTRLVEEIRAGVRATSLSPSPDFETPIEQPIEEPTEDTPAVVRSTSYPDLRAREPAVEEARSGPRGRIRRDLALAAGALFLLAAMFAVIRLGNRPTGPAVATETGDMSIAVLPLSNLSPDPRDAVLADGMTGELIAMLAKPGDLRVIGSTSAFAFRDHRLDVRTIAESLGVANVLEGGVQRSGSRIRVQVRLVSARDGSTRWSETYDRESEDLFAVQEEIAGSVARELGVRLAGVATPPLSRNRARNVAAYELYLRGSNTALLRSDSTARDGLEYFRQAIAIDSTYAGAWAGLARMYGRLAGSEFAEFPSSEMRSLAEEAALKAVALDDSLGEAHAALALVRLQAGDFVSAEREFKRAVGLDPNHARIREWLVHLYIRTGRPAEALAEARRALEIDPLSPTAHAEVARTLVANGRYDEALVHIEHIEDVQPPLLRMRGIAAQAYIGKKMWQEGIDALGCRSDVADPLCVYMFARGGRRNDALRVQAALLDRWRRGEDAAFEVAIGYTGLREFDQAFAWLDREIEDGSSDNYFSIMDPIFEDLHSDPRFQALRARLGIQNR